MEKKVLVVGSGISGMACAIRCAGYGIHVILASPYMSERSQSVMAAGGINGVTDEHEEGDSVESHIEDTLKGGAWLGGREAVTGLCSHAGEIIRYLEDIGTVFSVDTSGRPAVRAFGGQSHRRTHYGGSSTGKQIVSALVMEVRRYEAAGLIERRLRLQFHSALIRDGRCYGALFFNEASGFLEPIYADAVVMAVGGQNALFGKTTGSTLCDGYAAGKLFMQGAVLKNLEFIQYHPTTMETPQKMMLISEAARGEGGRLYYEEDDRPVYFMEDKYGPEGNLMTRDVVAREISEKCAMGKTVFLDVSFLNKRVIDARLPEVRDICRKYSNLDIKKEPVPVAPSVHFFMGGLAVHMNHETSIRDLYAVGECASMYHGANRLGGNSLLAAIYSGNVAADDISGRDPERKSADFTEFLDSEKEKLAGLMESRSTFSVMHIRDMLAETMHRDLGVIRSEKGLKEGLEEVDYYLTVAEHLRYDSTESTYTNYSLTGILSLARAVLTAAEARRESRGAHYRSDHLDCSDEYAYATLLSFDGGKYGVRLDKEHEFER